MLPLPRTIFGASIAAGLIVAIDVTPTIAIAGGEQPTYVSVGDNTRAPIGWVEFCTQQPNECIISASTPRDVVLTTKAWKDLARINKDVNDTIKPITDLE